MNKEYYRLYRETHRNRVNELARIWAKNNPDKRRLHGRSQKALECSYKYKKNHPEKVKEQNKRFSIKHPNRITVYIGKLRASEILKECDWWIVQQQGS